VASAPRYPNAVVVLSESDGNAFAILSRVSRALRKAGAEPDELEAFRKEAMSGDYNALLATCMRWVEVE